MYTYSFEKLRIWNESRKLVAWVYKITENFPQQEKFGLVSQLRRASISVVSNIAEGISRKGFKDQAHFSQISYSSLIEVLNQLIIANDLEFLENEKLREGREIIESLSSSISALRNSQLNRINSVKS